MPSPFPGMNPFLEAPALWPGVHSALSGEIRNTLNRQLPGRYFADVEERVYLCEADDPAWSLIIPDVSIDEQSTLPELRAESIRWLQKYLSAGA